MLHKQSHAGEADVRSAAPARARPGASWREGASASVLGLAVFALHLGLAIRLDRLGAFERFNTLFGADPNLRLEALRRADPLFRLAHPGLSYLLGVPVRALGRLAAALAPGDLTVDRAVRATALGVAPLASALTCVILLRLLRRLGLPFSATLVLTLLSAFSFSSIIFGSMPETFAVSALAAAIAYALLLRSGPDDGVFPELAWLAVGVFASGITITNVVPVALLYFLRAARKTARPGPALARAIVLAALAVFITLAAGVAAEKSLRVRSEPGPSEREWVAHYIVPRPVLHYAAFPSAVVDGIAPGPPVRLPGFAIDGRARLRAGPREAAPSDGEGTQGGAPGDTARAGAADTRLDARFRGLNARLAHLTFEPSDRPLSRRNLVGVALLAALAWAAFRRREGDALMASIARVSLAIIGFNWLLHGFWGGETFLYSQHWHVSLMLAIAALVAAARPSRRAVGAVLAVSVATIAANNLVILSRILSLLAGR
jgi:hypothetical protein